MKKASDIFVQALENEGVEYIFGIPGEENLDILDSLKDSKIKLVLTRHEQAAGFMAATYGRLTGHAGVCMSTLGPGATNFTTSAAYAQLGAMPMMMITGQKPIKKSKQGRFQIVDIVEMMKPLTKYTHQIVNVNNIGSRVREAFRQATQERPGAVHLELPEDIAAEETDNFHIFEKNNSRRPHADATAIAKAVSMIESAKNPLVLIGAGANRKRTSISLAKFIDATGIYFFNTQMGKGVIDERHPQYLGTAALSDNDYLHCAIRNADLIINVGHDVIEKPPFFMHQGGTKVIHVNFEPAEVDEVYFPQLNVVGDISSSITALTKANINMDNCDNSYFQRVKSEVSENLLEYTQDDRFPMLPQRFVHLIRKSMPDDGIITLDNGVYKLWFARNYPCYESNTLLLDNALATMGAGLPSAIAAKIINPNKKVITVCGDGGFMMNSQELETAVRLGLNLTVIILNDNAFGMIKWKQEGMGFDNFGLDYTNPDFVAYANSYGAIGHKPNNDQEFQDILQTCLTTDGVHVIELPVDYSLNHKILNESLKQKTCTL